jgi:hypothetical protein
MTADHRRERAVCAVAQALLFDADHHSIGRASINALVARYDNVM